MWNSLIWRHVDDVCIQRLDDFFGVFNIYADFISKKSPLFPWQPLEERKVVFQDGLHEAIAYSYPEEDPRRMFSL